MSEDLLVGVQIGPFSFYDEGIDQVLDLLQRTAGVNTVIPYSQTYYGGKSRSTELLADHGVPLKDERTRSLTRVWMEHHDEYFAGTHLRYRKGAGEEYADRDLFSELVEPLRKRGMRLYARILEPWGHRVAPYVPGWVKVQTVDAYGRIAEFSCWNNPSYRAFWLGTFEDMLKSYELDGIQFGSERAGPLSHVLFRGVPPTCFCEHCVEKGRLAGIDTARARRGFRELYELVNRMEAGERPPDGMLITILRQLLLYSEILAWERLQYESKEEVARLLYGAAKAIRPESQIGWHIDHQQTTWDPIWRANMDYGEMTPYSDFIKPILYHDIAGPRVRRWYIERLHRRFCGELTESQMLELFYAVRGYDPATEPALDELDRRGFSADYVYRETRRLVEAVAGRARVYPGIGFDVPYGAEPFPGAGPNGVYRASRRALEAGANGICISREYAEMRVENLEAVGRAVREHLR
jgi:hypothetical protein